MLFLPTLLSTMLKSLFIVCSVFSTPISSSTSKSISLSNLTSSSVVSTAFLLYVALIRSINIGICIKATVCPLALTAFAIAYARWLLPVPYEPCNINDFGSFVEKPCTYSIAVCLACTCFSFCGL
ncbi:Uncharacterised protein [Staphylococcus aureus]|nr:Uncharacterised protein [Staphylococcus aureus]